MSRYHYTFKDEYLTYFNAGTIHLVSALNKPFRSRVAESKDRLVKIKNVSSPADSYVISIMGTCLMTNQELVLDSSQYQIRHSIYVTRIPYDGKCRVMKYKDKIFTDGNDVGIVLLEVMQGINKIIISKVLLGNKKLWVFPKNKV